MTHDCIPRNKHAAMTTSSAKSMLEQREIADRCAVSYYLDNQQQIITKALTQTIDFALEFPALDDKEEIVLDKTNLVALCNDPDCSSYSEPLGQNQTPANYSSKELTTPLDPDQVYRERQLKVYLDNGATSLTPQVIITALTNVNNLMGNPERSTGTNQLRNIMVQAKEVFTNYLDPQGNPKNLTFTAGCTDSINLVASVLTRYYRKQLASLAALAQSAKQMQQQTKSNYTEAQGQQCCSEQSCNEWKSDSSDSSTSQLANSSGTLPTYYILIAESNHHANILPWVQLCEELPQIKLLRLKLDKRGRIDLANLALQAASLGDKLLLCSYSSIVNSNGVRNNYYAIKQILNKFAPDCFVMLDNAQGTTFNEQIFPMSGCYDFLVGSIHKMYGPTGLGYLLTSQRIQDIAHKPETAVAKLHKLMASWNKTDATTTTRATSRRDTSNTGTSSSKNSQDTIASDGLSSQGNEQENSQAPNSTTTPQTKNVNFGALVSKIKQTLSATTAVCNSTNHKSATNQTINQTSDLESAKKTLTAEEAELLPLNDKQDFTSSTQFATNLSSQTNQELDTACPATDATPPAKQGFFKRWFRTCPTQQPKEGGKKKIMHHFLEDFLDSCKEKPCKGDMEFVTNNIYRDAILRFDLEQFLAQPGLAQIAQLASSNKTSRKIHPSLNIPLAGNGLEAQRVGGGNVSSIRWSQDIYQPGTTKEQLEQLTQATISYEFHDSNPFYISGTNNYYAVSMIPVLVNWLKEHNKFYQYHATHYLMHDLKTRLAQLPGVVYCRDLDYAQQVMASDNYLLLILPCEGHTLWMMANDNYLADDLATQLLLQDILVRVGKHCCHLLHQRYNLDQTLRISSAPFITPVEIEYCFQVISAYLQQTYEQLEPQVQQQLLQEPGQVPYSLIEELYS